MEKPKFKREWKGRHVRLRRDIETKGGDVFEQGSVMLVEKNYGGLQLRGTIECDCCGGTKKRWVKNVSEYEVDLLDSDFVLEDNPRSVRESVEIRRLKDLVQDMQRQMIELMPGSSHG